ncbi:MAG: TonB-dependent receptor [Bryobacterales bacterium]|nr:TonB-dependent receptor [Bryobacterales bacterium]
MKALVRISLCLLLTVSMCTAIANAQVLYGSLTGLVTDASSSVVPGASVTATNTETGIQTKTETNASGNYALSNLRPGLYNLSVTAQGFRTSIQEGVNIVINTATRSNIALQLGQVTEQVTVEASAISLQTEKTDVSASLSSKEVTSLPLPAFRNYQSLLDLVPGTTPARFQNSVTDTPARALTTNVNGTARNMNTTRVDGAVNVFVWLPHHVAYVPPAETVETVNISTNNFDAEQGLAGGAAVTLATKSGTNEFHGVGFWYHDNQHLFARPYFLQPTQEKPLTINNIYGGTFGGPIVKNKWFFFGGYEANRQRLGGNLLATIATADQRAGNFASVAGTNLATTIYDPATGGTVNGVTGVGRTAFANNIIPVGRISQTAIRAQNLVPLPNNGAGVVNNFVAAGSRMFDRYNYDFKTDYNVTETWRLWGKYSQMDADVTALPAFGQGIGPGIAGDPGTGNTPVKLVTVGTTASLSATTLIDGNFGWNNMDQTVTSVDYGNFVGQELGIPGTNDQTGSDIRYSGTPAFSVDGYQGWGLQQGWMPLFRNDTSWTGNSNVSMIKGNHNIRFGVDMVQHQLNHWQPEIDNPRGAFTFNQGLTANRTLTGTTASTSVTTPANAYAGYLLGQVSQTGKSVQFQEMSGREWQFGFYLRDRWQVTQKLTATLGVRYEFYPLIHRAETGIEYYDTERNVVERGGVGGNPQDLGISVSKKLIAPRIGFAYKLTDKTVIRAGYGITYNPIPLSRPLRGFYPLTIAQTVDPGDALVPASTFSQGIPIVALPDPNEGTLPVPTNVQVRSIWSPEGERQLNRGYIQSWNMMMEQEVSPGLVASVGYVGTKTVRSFGDWNSRTSAPGTGLAGVQSFQQFGRNASTLLWNGWLDTQYHGLQANLNGRIASGLVLRGSYTWSKAMNWADDDGWTGITWNDPAQWDRNWARAGFDRTHNFQIGGSYDMPFGRGKQYLNEGAAAAILGNWQLNGTMAIFSGTPFTIGSSGSSLNNVGNTQTADQVKDTVDTPKAVGPGQLWFDRTAYAQVQRVGYGNTGRNSLRGPGVFNTNVSVFRDFPIGERFVAQFKTEFFNFTNTPIFNNPSSSANSGTFGQITSTNTGYGSPSERNIRFGLRLSF